MRMVVLIRRTAFMASIFVASLGGSAPIVAPYRARQVATLGFTLAAAQARTPLTPQQTDAIDSFVRAELAREHIPGLAVGVGEGHFHWLLNAQEIGMNPLVALTSATHNVAKAFKKDKDLGTLEPGKFADLLILDKNPLENAKNYRNISLVMKGGQHH